jgi:ABC-type sugar transport system substrate-binding protein
MNRLFQFVYRGKLRIVRTAAAMVVVATIATVGMGPSSANASPLEVANAYSFILQYLKAPSAVLSVGKALPKRPPRGKLFVELATAEPGSADYYGGLQVALKAIGWRYKQVTYDQSNPQTIQTAFASALALHPTAVSEVGLSESQFGSNTIATYKKAGIPIILAASWPVAVNKTILGTPAGGQNNVVYGKVLGNWLIADSDASGKALVVNVPTYTIFNPFISSLQSTVANGCKNCSLVSVNLTLAELIAGTANSTVVAALQANPGYNYVIYSDAGFAGGINSSLSAAGLNNIKIAGAAMNPTAAGELQTGAQSAWLGFPTNIEAYQTVDIALRHLEKVPLTPLDNVMPTELFTPDTIGTVSDWQGPAGAFAQFKRIWHV